MRHKILMGCLCVAFLVVVGGCGSSSPTGVADSATPSSGSSAAQSAVQSKAPVAKPVVVDSGTDIVVTVDQAISTKAANPGDHFDVSLAEPLLAGDRQVVPRGAKAVGVVTEAKSAGRVKGGAVLAVSLESITVGGENYAVHTDAVEQTGKGRGERTAIGAGGGAAVGAIVGAIAGGGKGAAIGAGAGAGAGTAGAVLTGNREIEIPAETKLNFKLTQPLEIRPK
jgi:hypothetical protein